MQTMANHLDVADLMAENAQLREALKFALEVMESYAFSNGNDPRTATPESAIGRARAALDYVGSPRGQS